MVQFTNKRRTASLALNTNFPLSPSSSRLIVGVTLALVTVLFVWTSLFRDESDYNYDTNKSIMFNGSDEVAVAGSSSSSSGSSAVDTTAISSVSYKTPLAYGTKGLRDPALLTQALDEAGFRHIVTCGHHSQNNETVVGQGWRKSKIPRNELFLQTCFVPTGNTKDFQYQPITDHDVVSKEKYVHLSIEEQVHNSIKSSLSQLQTNYLDAVLFHQFRAQLYDQNEILKAWTVLEEYVQKGVIKQLGLTSVHKAHWFETFYNKTTIKPTIVQNRFHSNRQYDVGPMQDIFHHSTKYPNLQIQRFWLLNGSTGMGNRNKDMASRKNVTPAQLMLGFIMTMEETCLVGTHNIQHMKDDMEMMNCYPSLFINEEERIEYATKMGMLKQKQKQTIQNQPLPGSYNGGNGNDNNDGSIISRPCQATQ